MFYICIVIRKQTNIEKEFKNKIDFNIQSYTHHIHKILKVNSRVPFIVR